MIALFDNRQTEGENGDGNKLLSQTTKNLHCTQGKPFWNHLLFRQPSAEPTEALQQRGRPGHLRNLLQTLQLKLHLLYPDPRPLLPFLGILDEDRTAGSPSFY